MQWTHPVLVYCWYWEFHQCTSLTTLRTSWSNCLLRQYFCQDHGVRSVVVSDIQDHSELDLVSLCLPVCVALFLRPPPLYPSLFCLSPHCSLPFSVILFSFLFRLFPSLSPRWLFFLPPLVFLSPPPLTLFLWWEHLSAFYFSSPCTATLPRWCSLVPSDWLLCIFAFQYHSQWSMAASECRI